MSIFYVYDFNYGTISFKFIWCKPIKISFMHSETLRIYGVHSRRVNRIIVFSIFMTIPQRKQPKQTFEYILARSTLHEVSSLSGRVGPPALWSVNIAHKTARPVTLPRSEWRCSSLFRLLDRHRRAIFIISHAIFFLLSPWSIFLQIEFKGIIKILYYA